MTTTAYPFRKALALCTTATAFTARLPTVTFPSTSATIGVFDLFDRNLGIAVETTLPDRIQIMAFLVGADNVTGDIRLIGWSKDTTHPTPIWIPQILAQIGVVGGDLASTALEASSRLADTYTLTYGAAAADGDLGAGIISPANDVPGSIIIHTRGCERIEFQFDVGTATSMNALWRPLHHL